MREIKSSGWLSRLFHPQVNFYALLNEQAQTTLAGMLALESYMSSGDSAFAEKVRDLEKQADEEKLTLEKQLADSFVTPFDREDIYDISLYMDEIINCAKATVREMEALEVPGKDAQLKEMAGTLVEGTRNIVNAVAALNNKIREAADQSQLARKSDSRYNKVYRRAIRDLFDHNDPKIILRMREIYRCLARVAAAIDRLGEKLLHVIVKMT